MKLWPWAPVFSIRSSRLAAAMQPKVVPSVAVPLKPLLLRLSASKAQLSSLWTALAQCSLAVEHSRHWPLTTDNCPSWWPSWSQTLHLLPSLPWGFSLNAPSPQRHSWYRYLWPWSTWGLLSVHGGCGQPITHKICAFEIERRQGGSVRLRVILKLSHILDLRVSFNGE